MFIAEIGINHNGDVDIAKRLIAMAHQAGCDYVKFQKRNPEKCVPQKMKNKIVDSVFGEMKYIDYKRRLEFNRKEYAEIDAFCKKMRMPWFASVWDTDSVRFVNGFDVPFIKIPSPMLTNNLLIDAACRTKKAVILSTGMSTGEEIDKAVKRIDKHGNELIILHCVSSYPAKDEEVNLLYIKTLKEKYPRHTIGYSGHEEGISAMMISKVLGAEVFERHITLSRSMKGTDQAASLVFDQVFRLTRDLKRIDLWLGDGIKKVYPSEEILKNKLRQWRP